MFIIGLCIHVIFLFSIFDIYFKSPIVRDVVPYQPHHESVADRLVLFVVDGLRAESFVNYTTMAYMRSIASSNGRWGISHTRVPTESRPGHVAVIAGFYEDPSAIAKGWKENPVDFDSVFNQTKYTWCWGTYDIVDIFTKGAVDDHISVHKFDPYDQGFSTDKNTTLLDGWVFHNVEEFFQRAKHDVALKDKLHQKRIVFFLHLLGTDTSGHTHKPKTEQFLTTLRFVDEGISKIEQIIRQFYDDDGKTTFLMTADHGMTDWGSHGAGDDHETQTPYVLWGSGVHQKPVSAIDSSTLNLPSDNRLDINQADLTPLMSTMIAVPVPVNSIGRLPTELLNMTLPNKAKAIYSNCRQLASQYHKKKHDVESHAISLLYQPYEPLDKRKYQEFIDNTEKLLTEEKYDRLIILSEEIMSLSLSGLLYYHNYYQRPLLVLVTLAFCGWIACLLKTLLQQNISTQIDVSSRINKNAPDRKTLRLSGLNILFIGLCLVSIYLVYEQNLPPQYHIYFLLTILLWWYALSSSLVWRNSLKLLKEKRQIATVVTEFLCYTMGSLAMGLSFTYRWMLSIPLIGMALWPFFSTARSHLSKTILCSWSVSCILLSGFTFMPVVGKQVFIELVVVAGFIWMIFLAAYTYKILRPLCHQEIEQRREIILSIFQIIILIVSLENIYAQSKRFERGTPVSSVYQTLAWTIAVASLVLPLTSSNRLICRVMAINTSVLTFYLLLSVSHEGLFLVTLIFNTICWICIEFRIQHSNKSQPFLITGLTLLKTLAPFLCVTASFRAVQLVTKLINFSFDNEKRHSKDGDQRFMNIERSVSHQDFRRAFFFLLYIIIAFFGTGNIASLNSFEVRWVTCFVTSYQPFLITGLILLKTLAPFLCVAASFRAVQLVTKAPTGYLNVVVLIYSNIMGIQLLYYVRNTGSWLEIGTSISQFVIVQVITLFIVLIHQIARILTDVNIYSIIKKVMFRGRKKYV